MDDVFGDRAPDRRRVLDAVAAEAGGEQQVGQFRVRPDEGVLVEGAVFVVAGPCISLPDRIERGDALGQGRPDPLLEQGVIDRQWESVLVLLGPRRDGRDERLALRPEPDAGRIDDERAVRCGGLCLFKWLGLYVHCGPLQLANFAEAFKASLSCRQTHQTQEGENVF